MGPVFSASGNGGESSAIAELHLLADSELISLWEQTQMAASVIEGQGGNAHMARVYEKAIVLEMQRRQAFRPASSVFGTEKIEAMPESSPALPHIMVIH